MLEVQNLHKVYGGFQAVNDVSFSLKPGDIFGFIGSNGAGKTTTIRMIATLLEPTSGTARLDGLDVVKEPLAVRRKIGYMPDFFGVYDDVKCWEYLDFFAAIYEVKNREKVIDEVLELTDLTVKRNAFVQSLSRGMQQRLCLARCLLHDPTLLLLDEPASGLDPRARSELKELIAELGRLGKIVIVSSHILPELAGFCNTVGMIEKGELLAFGAIGDVVRSFRTVRQLRVRSLDDPHTVVTSAMKVPGVGRAEVIADGQVAIEFAGDDDGQSLLLGTLIDSRHRIISFTESEAGLEDVFLRLTTGAVN